MLTTWSTACLVEEESLLAFNTTPTVSLQAVRVIYTFPICIKNKLWLTRCAHRLTVARLTAIGTESTLIASGVVVLTLFACR